MSRRPFLLAVAVAVSLSGVAQPPALAATAALTVTVLDDATGRAVPGGCVDVQGPDATGNWTTQHLCDPGGVVTVDGLDTATGYYLQGSDPAPGSYLIPTSPTAPVTPPDSVVIRLPHGALTTGRVTQWDGTPATGTVNLVPVDPAIASGPSADIAADGTWRVLTPAGRYTVQFITNTPGNYAADLSWAFGRRTSAAADPVTVSPDRVVTINQVVPKPSTISGHVSDAATGAPITNACLYAVLATDVNGPGFALACTANDGSYTTSGYLPPGRYAVHVPAPSSRYATVVSQPVTVVGGRNSVVDVAVPLGATMTGTVVDAATGSPIAGICPTVSNSPAALGAIEDQRPSCSDATGSWSVAGLPAGRLQVRLAPPFGDTSHAAAWAAQAATQSAATRYRTTAGATTAVGVTRLSTGATLVGHVVDEAGRPVPDVTVYLVDCGCMNSDLNTTDANGDYTIGGIVPGSYVASFQPAATPASLAWQWSGGATDPTRAARLALVEGRTTRADATLHPGATLTVTQVGGTRDGLSVQVTTPGGTPIGAQAQLYPGQLTGTITNLPPGSVRVRYTVTSSQPVSYWYDRAATLRSATPVSLTALADTAITVRPPSP